jgi:hypothetical protein
MRQKLKYSLLIPRLLCLGLLCIAGCSSAKKDAADAALATSTEAFTAIREDAVKYAPGQSAQVEESIRSAQDSLAKGDYSRALAVAKDIPTQIQELSASIKDRKDQLREEWEDLTEIVPALIRAASRHIDALNREHKSTISAREILAEARKQWQTANASYSADELLPAIASANEAKETLAEFKKELNAKP